MPKTAIPAAHLKLKRAYVPAEASDGLRILVDRLWPRGVSKQKAALDDWNAGRFAAVRAGSPAAPLVAPTLSGVQLRPGA